MSKVISLKIATPERVVLQESVDQVSIPTQDGEITILPNHIPLIAALGSGDIVAMQGDEQIPMAVVGGFVQVKVNEIIILADFAEHVEEITDEEIEKATKRAEELKKGADTVSKEDFEHFAAELERSLTVARIGGKWKSKKYRKTRIYTK